MFTSIDQQVPVLSAEGRPEFPLQQRGQLAQSDTLTVVLEEVAKGGARSCALPVREVLSAALRHDGVAFALAHNHPGGDPTPTEADGAATLRVADAAAQVGLRFLDHVVVTDAAWRSVSASRRRSRYGRRGGSMPEASRTRDGVRSLEWPVS